MQKSYIVQATRFQGQWYGAVPQLDLWFRCVDYAELVATARREISDALGVRATRFVVDVHLQPAWDGGAAEMV